MIELHDWIAAASAWWWPKLADHVWQSTLFAIVVLLATFLLRRGPARLRHTLWLIGSAKFLVPAAFLAFLSATIGIDSLLLTAPQSETGAVLQSIAEPLTSLTNNYDLTVTANSSSHNELYCGLTAIWLGGCAILIVTWWLSRDKCRRALSQSYSVHSGREWLALKRAKELLRLRYDVRLMLSPQEVEPGVFHIWQPIILLPESVADHLEDEELLAIMLHELVHIQRRDILIGRLQLVMTGFFWFHPLVWFISRRLSDEREQVCDERVLEIHGTPATYAASILKVVRFSFGWNVAGITGAGSGSNLRRRIDNIMLRNGKHSAGILVRIVTSAALGIALVAIVAAASHKRPSEAAQRINSQEIATGLGSMDYSSDQRTRAVQEKIPSPPQSPAPPPGEGPAQAEAPASPAQPVNPASRVNGAVPAQPQNPPQPPTPAQPRTPEQPPAPPAKPASTQEKSGDAKQKVTKGELIEAPRPIYPEEAKAKRIEGQVSVSIVIGEEGNVISARPTSGPELLQGAAKDAALKARFKPTFVDGKAAKVSGVMTYNFVLDEKEKSE